MFEIVWLYGVILYFHSWFSPHSGRLIVPKFLFGFSPGPISSERFSLLRSPAFLVCSSSRRIFWHTSFNLNHSVKTVINLFWHTRRCTSCCRCFLSARKLSPFLRPDHPQSFFSPFSCMIWTRYLNFFTLWIRHISVSKNFGPYLSFVMKFDFLCSFGILIPSVNDSL